MPPGPRLLQFVESVWARMQEDRAHAGPLVSMALRETRWLGSKERRAAGDMLLGLVRHERALARIDADPVRAWLALADGVPDLEDPENAYAIATSTPDWLGAEWWERLGPERAVEHARVIAGRAPVCLRVLRGPVEIPVRHRYVGPAAVLLEEGANVEAWPIFRDGHVIVQDLGSQRIAEAAFVPGARVMDLCAGAGGKALALAALGAKVQAWDVRRGALDELKRRAARAGVDVRIGPPKGRYDVALVDAPCSGTGVLRRHPENRWKLAFPTETQRELLTRALEIADRVVYATCALTRRENEDVAHAGGEVVRETTWWPEADGGDGFYVAEVRRR